MVCLPNPGALGVVHTDSEEGTDLKTRHAPSVHRADGVPRFSRVKFLSRVRVLGPCRDDR